METVWLVVIIVSGVGVGVLLLFALFFCCWRMRRGGGSSEAECQSLLNPTSQREYEEQANRALMSAQFFLRSHPDYSMDKPLARIGSRHTKHYFAVHNTKGPNVILALVSPSQSCPFPLQTEGNAISDLITKMGGHPHIATPVDCTYLPSGNFFAMVRQWQSKGTLRDYIHQDSPIKQFSKKYQSHYSLPDKMVAKFGRQILEGLLFFRIQGYPYFHLHAGNVLVANGMCQLSDYENGLLSLEPYHRRIITALAPKVDPDVVCFACVLWEMVTGYELDSVDTANFQLASLSWNPKIRNVLDSVFHQWSGAAPTLDDLIAMELFSEVVLPKQCSRKKLEINKKEEKILTVAMEAMVSVVKTGKSSVLIDVSPTTSPKQKQTGKKYVSPFDVPPIASSAPATTTVQKPNAPVAQQPPKVKPASSNPFEAPVASGSGGPATTTKSPPPPPPPPVSSSSPPVSHERNALLASIRSFDVNSLKTDT